MKPTGYTILIFLIIIGSQSVDLLDIADTLRRVNASEFASALEKANLTSLVGEGKITLFAPSDNAIASSNGQNDINVVVVNTADKIHFVRDILRSHIVPGPDVYSTDGFHDELRVWTASEGSDSERPSIRIRINVYGMPAVYTANCAVIQSSDHQTANGTIIHVVDKVLIPVQRNVWQLIEDDPRFSVMRSLVDEKIKRHLNPPWYRGGSLTLLAFTNEVVEKLPQPTRQRILRKDSCFDRLLLTHLVDHCTVCAAAIHDERLSSLWTDADRRINVTRSADGVIRIANHRMIAADKMATNGVMHVIDGVILSPEMLDMITVLEQSDSPGPEFARALQSHGLAQSLDASEQPITLFVPPIEFIAKMSSSDLRQHIVRGDLFARTYFNLGKPQTVTTDAEWNITFLYDYHHGGWFARDEWTLFVGCAREEQSLESCNGTIRYLDRPLSHPTQTAYELMKSKPELSEFVSMIEQAGLIGTVKGPKLNGTVLAPTNAALERGLNGTTKRRLLSDNEQLRRFLKDYIMLGAKCCYALSGSEWPMPGRWSTMAGTTLDAYGDSTSMLNLGGADVQQCDLVATNGIVHVLDNVVISRVNEYWPRLWSRHLNG